jgi:hypothetical protein
MSEAHGVVARLLHRPQHQCRDRPLFRRALHSVYQFLEVLWPDRVPARGEAVAERRDEHLEVFDLLEIRCLVHAVQRRHVIADQVRRDRLVRQEHELLDDPVRDVALHRDDVLDLAVLREDDFRFRQIEVDRSAATPALMEDREELVHQLEHRHERLILGDRPGIAIREDRVHRGVGHARVAVDHPVVHFIADDGSPRVDFHHTRLHEPIDMRIEAA